MPKFYINTSSKTQDNGYSLKLPKLKRLKKLKTYANSSKTIICLTLEQTYYLELDTLTQNSNRI